MERVLALMTLCLVLAASGCSSHVELKDLPLYWPAPGGGATRSWTISESTDQLPESEWKRVVEQGIVAMSYESYGWFRETIEKLCSENRTLCRQETKKKMQSFFSRMDRARHTSRTWGGNKK